MALSADEVLSLLAQAGVPRTTNGLGRWLAIAKAESSLDPAVVNSIGATGLFQINQPVHVKAHPTWTKEWLKVPANNVAAARTVSDNWTNTRPWVSSVLGQTANLPASQLQATRWLQSPAERAAESAIVQGGALASAASEPLLGPVKAIADTTVKLTNPRFWLRASLVVVGAGLVLFGVNQLAGGALADSQVGRAVIGNTKKVITKGAA